MTEEFLQYVWKLKLFNTLNLFTTSGEPLQIIHSGTHNTDSGPDFFNARLNINNVQWAGNVEIHTHSRNWKKHNHQHDKAYDNIILHVVYKDDSPLYHSSGEKIPTLELKDKIATKLYEQYINFNESTDWIPCEKQMHKVFPFTIHNTIDNLIIERLERKTIAISQGLSINNNNWEETFYQHLARNFGFKTNAQPFEMLAKSLPHTILAKHKNNLLQIEAMLFGQAGLLENHFNDNYLRTLQNEYIFLKQKYQLKAIEPHLWKFLRLRPINFPTIRIAQFAGLIFRSLSLFSKIISYPNLDEIKQLFYTDVSNYWHSHYLFEKESKFQKKHIGEQAIDTIIINTIIPFLFIYEKKKNNEEYTNRALQFLEQLPGEQNSIINQWNALRVPVKNAYSTQALLQLKSEYCDKKRCLQCSIGNELLKNH